MSGVVVEVVVVVVAVRCRRKRLPIVVLLRPNRQSEVTPRVHVVVELSPHVSVVFVAEGVRSHMVQFVLAKPIGHVNDEEKRPPELVQSGAILWHRVVLLGHRQVAVEE